MWPASTSRGKLAPLPGNKPPNPVDESISSLRANLSKSSLKVEKEVRNWNDEEEFRTCWARKAVGTEAFWFIVAMVAMDLEEGNNLTKGSIGVKIEQRRVGEGSVS